MIMNNTSMREALEAARNLLLPQCNGGTAFAKACGETVNKIMDALKEERTSDGDCAKLREALKLCVDEMCDRCRELAAARGNPLPCLSGCEPVRKAKAALRKAKSTIAALAAPVRNCDVARDWLHLYIHFKPPATVRREMPPEWVDAVMAFCKWLVAQAKDTKGESDGSK